MYEADRYFGSRMNGHIIRPTGRQKGRLTNAQTDRQTKKQNELQRSDQLTDLRTDIPTDEATYRQFNIDSQLEGQTYNHSDRK